MILLAVVDVPGGGKCLVGVVGREEGADRVPPSLPPESGTVLRLPGA